MHDYLIYLVQYLLTFRVIVQIGQLNKIGTILQHRLLMLLKKCLNMLRYMNWCLWVAAGLVALGTALGTALGAALGTALGAALGAALGTALGSALGSALGAALGSVLGVLQWGVLVPGWIDLSIELSF